MNTEDVLNVDVRVAPLRMGVRRVAPGSQVLPDFEVRSCPQRAASADQDSLSGPLLGIRHRDFSVRISKQQNLWETANFLETAKYLFERNLNRKISVSVSQKRPQQAALIHRSCPSRAASYFKIW